MSRRLVKTDHLNLRSTPDKTTDDNIISAMPLGQEVTVINAPSGELFWEIETKVDGQTQRGFASSKYLREPLSSTKEKLLAAAVREWVMFKRGAGQEYDDPYSARVGDYWEPFNSDLDGDDRGYPWSAAFISFIVREAGYTDFKFSEGHSRYIRDAKKKRLSNTAEAPFWLFRLNEHKPKLGDLVCAWRPDGETPDNRLVKTYDQVANDSFPSHTDVIVEIGDDFVKTIGGNVAQSVKDKTFPLDANGFITAADKRFAIMRNNR